MGVPPCAGSARRAQSVLDLVEVDVCFALRGFVEGDDADFMFGLCVNDRNRDSGQKAERLEPLFPLLETCICKGVGPAFKDARCVEEVKAVISEIEGAFAL